MLSATTPQLWHHPHLRRRRGQHQRLHDVVRKWTEVALVTGRLEGSPLAPLVSLGRLATSSRRASSVLGRGARLNPLHCLTEWTPALDKSDAHDTRRAAWQVARSLRHTPCRVGVDLFGRRYLALRYRIHHVLPQEAQPEPLRTSSPRLLTRLARCIGASVEPLPSSEPRVLFVFQRYVHSMCAWDVAGHRVNPLIWNVDRDHGLTREDLVRLVRDVLRLDRTGTVDVRLSMRQRMVMRVSAGWA